MERRPVTLDIKTYPTVFHEFLKDATLYDSSCSPSAKVIFLDKDDGYFLKSSDKGTLEREATMTAFFHERKLAAEVIAYYSGDKDYMLTRRICGEDLCYAPYLNDPKRLAAVLGEILRELHETDISSFTLPNRIKEYLALAERNYRAGQYDGSLFSGNWGYRSAEEAWQTLCEGRYLLKNDTLIHGDYCLPNLLLDNWRFSGFIDLGNSGIGDRHIDLFWGAWTLFFNLKTEAYTERFFDAYGKDRVEKDILRVVAAAEVFG